MCHGLLSVEGGRTAEAGVVFKGSASAFETRIPLKCLWLTQAGLSESYLQHFVCFSTSFPQTETEIDAHTLLNILLHYEIWRTLLVDVHREASTERMRGDTGFWFCKYTCREFPHVLPCCHFAAYYSFPRKKSVPELNDQSSYKICIKTSHNRKYKVFIHSVLIQI